MAKSLTVLSVEKAPAKETRYELSDAGGPLRLIVQPSGAKSWGIRYRIGSRTRKHTLGSFPALGLLEARRLARVAMEAIAAGDDPAEDKAARRASDLPQTIDELAVQFVQLYAKKNCKTRTWQETARILGLEADPEMATSYGKQKAAAMSSRNGGDGGSTLSSAEMSLRFWMRSQ